MSANNNQPQAPQVVRHIQLLKLSPESDIGLEGAQLQLRIADDGFVYCDLILIGGRVSPLVNAYEPRGVMGAPLWRRPIAEVIAQFENAYAQEAALAKPTIIDA